jgi:NAD(P)-dependent dehydrogenase (short-subunit alcohol dehydrogenase family)
MKKVLITSVGSGVGLEASMRLAEKGFDVISSVEIQGEVQPLKRAATARGVKLQVEKLDVTSEGDREKALGWGVEILVNTAGVLEGGSVVDIPRSNMRNEFEVNVIGPLLLTQGIAKQMVKRQQGRIVGVSSREGINVNPFAGVYAASKHAIEAIAAVAAGELDSYRNLEPKSMLSETKRNIEAPWEKKVRSDLGKRSPGVQRCYEMRPETPVPS